MEANKNIQIVQTKKLDDKEYTFVFDPSEDMHQKIAFRTKLWQLFPVICASTVFLPFGFMLGWPSPMYPILLNKTTTTLDREITLDESAMIAGFLMIGNTIATPLSATYLVGSKYGIMIGSIFMLFGWIGMWQARNIIWLLISRLVVGIGNGYGSGQLKHYIMEISEENYGKFLIKQAVLYVLFGVVLAFIVGPLVDFRKFGMTGVIISVITLFLSIFLPTTPRELLRNEKVTDAKKLIVFLSPTVNVDDEIARIKNNMNSQDECIGWLQLLRAKHVHKNFALFGLLVFFQQFTGIPATIVYSQRIFEITNCIYPQFCALIYCVVYFFTNIFGMYWATQYNKKIVLILSTVGVCIVLIVEIFVLVYDLDQQLYNLSFIVMLIYNIVHTLGLGNIPVSLIPELFPQNARLVISHFFIMAHSMFALVLTKIFQVLMDRCAFYIPFCFFLSISIISLLFIIIFIPKNQTKAQK